MVKVPVYDRPRFPGLKRIILFVVLSLVLTLLSIWLWSAVF